MLRHDPGTSSENPPGKHGTEKSISYSDPCGSNSVLPSELTRIPYEYDCGKIACSVCESRKPGTYASASEYESVYIGSVFTAVKTDSDHYGKEYYEH